MSGKQILFQQLVSRVRQQIGGNTDPLGEFLLVDVWDWCLRTDPPPYRLEEEIHDTLAFSVEVEVGWKGEVVNSRSFSD